MPTKPTINEFLESLGVNLAVKRASWDGLDESTDTVVMKLWFSEAKPKSADKLIRVWTDRKPNETAEKIGRNERLRSIAHLAAGRPTYAVMREGIGTDDPASKRFDAVHLRKLNGIVKRANGDVYVKVGSLVTIDQYHSRRAVLPSVAQDIAQIEQRFPGPKNATVRQTMVQARLGQGRYRSGVLSKWGNACAVTGCSNRDVLIASHVMAWSDPNHDEATRDQKRLDANNGLPLLANLDRLFDKHLIAFDPATKEMLVSKALSKKDRELLGVPLPLRKKPTREQADYLRYHLDLFRAGQDA